MVRERQRGISGSSLNARGTRDGLVIRLPEEPTSLDLVQDFQDDIERSRHFFHRGELIIDYGTRHPDLEEIRALQVVLRERAVRLRTVTAQTDKYRDMLESWGFRQPRARRSKQVYDARSR